MVRPLPADYLQPDEEILLLRDREMRSVIDEYLAILLGWVVLGGIVLALFFVFLDVFLASVGVPILLLLTASAILLVILRYRRVATTRYVVTPERVYAASGRLVFALQQTTYDKVTDMQLHQSFFGRIWGFGTITLQTAGTGIMLDGVHDPVAVKQRIETARRRFIDTLVGEHLAERGAPNATITGTADTPPAEATETVSDAPPHGTEGVREPVWRGGPSLASLMTSLATTVVIILVALGSSLFGVLQGTLPGLLIGGAFILIAFVTLVGTWIEYRFTRYEVHPDGVVLTRGWLSRRRVETTYDKVTDVSTQQGVLGRVMGFGTITVNTAGSNQAAVVFRGLHHPDDVKRIIDETRRSHREGRRR